MREQALALAERSADNPNRLYLASRAVVRRPDADAAAYRRALRLAENACRLDPDNGYYLNTLGAALYRAGRFAEAVRRLEEAVQKRNGVSIEADWVFLAMAHQRLGHHDEARRWLDRFRDRSPNLDPSAFWDELEIRLLRAEAEAVVLWDPIFPADPFAP